MSGTCETTLLRNKVYCAELFGKFAGVLRGRASAQLRVNIAPKPLEDEVGMRVSYMQIEII